MSDETFSELLARRRSVRDYGAGPIPADTLGRLLRVAQEPTGDGVHRAAPSAHSLYPLRLLVTAGRVDGLQQGTYAVDPLDNALTLVTSRDLRPRLRAAAFDDQPWVANAAAIISIYADLDAANAQFRDQKPVGRRGDHYVFIEAGAVAQNVLLQATALNVATVLVAGFDDDETARIQALDLAPLLHICMGLPADGS